MTTGLQIREFVDGKLNDERFCETPEEAIAFVEMSAFHIVGPNTHEAALWTVYQATGHGSLFVDFTQGLTMSLQLVVSKPSLWQRIKILFGARPDPSDDEDCQCPACNPHSPYDQENEKW